MLATGLACNFGGKSNARYARDYRNFSGKKRLNALYARVLILN
jgi:hypothetical protein